MNRLTELANKYNCDKGTTAYEAHGYTEEYEKIIPETGKYTLLEIGVWHGDSLRMWNKYNPELVIYGMDIDQNSHNFRKDDDPIWFIGDATDSKFLDIVLRISGPPDFIIDDGSHNSDDIIASFKYLYPKLKKGGYYCIEDLHASQAKIKETMKCISEMFLFEEFFYPDFDYVYNNKLWIIQK